MTQTHETILTVELFGIPSEREVTVLYDYTPADDEGCVLKAAYVDVLSVDFRWEDKYGTRQAMDVLPLLDKYATQCLEKYLREVTESEEPACAD